MVTARFGSDPSKRTVCVYGHVDVQPAKMEDGWATEPYNLTDLNGNGGGRGGGGVSGTWLRPLGADPVTLFRAGNLYGRGASDNKAPVLAWIHAVEAYGALSLVRTAGTSPSHPAPQGV